MGETLVWKMKINKEKISINKKMEIISKNNYIKIHTFSLNQKINKNKQLLIINNLIILHIRLVKQKVL